jgi:hypothetical protein
MRRHVQVDNLATIWIGKAGRSYLGCTNEDTVPFQPAKENTDRFFNLQLVRLEDNFRIERFFVLDPESTESSFYTVPFQQKLFLILRRNTFVRNSFRTNSDARREITLANCN